ncbi:hypothetical protein EU805_05510 [Salipiger sp. IMCC34102]|uniref:hypothetical protein n=1 Tax=Salipiger sp. IMCC34102 TaxID=2510647 RepID=UPI00101E1ECB|nr:hypothetical protein [Salipiger sp. IMCC34102]RYH03187.1 hypothetical protein EU805_05510 [Salipiger sp. IMCC34102]
MMTRLTITAAALFAFAAPAAAEVLPMMPSDPLDGPYVSVEQVSAEMAEPMTYARVVEMSDMDGDPTVTTDEEERMIALLSQVLTVAPVAQ